MTVLVWTPTLIMTTALLELFRNFGLEAHNEVGQAANVAIYDLVGVSPPYPPPPPAIPTFAIVASKPQTQDDLTTQGYSGYFSPATTTQDVIEALKNYA